MTWQPVLEGELLRLIPLQPEHFELLLLAAGDPRIWEQHPEPTRWQRAVFARYFHSGIESAGALVATDRKSGRFIGSSRFYDRDLEKGFVYMGYTFLACDFWGGGYNRELKKLMLTHAFQHVQEVYFQIGAQNFRSQQAMLKIGGIRVPRGDSYGFVYRIGKAEWQAALTSDGEAAAQTAAAP